MYISVCVSRYRANIMIYLCRILDKADSFMPVESFFSILISMPSQKTLSFPFWPNYSNKYLKVIFFLGLHNHIHNIIKLCVFNKGLVTRSWHKMVDLTKKMNYWNCYNRAQSSFLLNLAMKYKKYVQERETFWTWIRAL